MSLRYDFPDPYLLPDSRFKSKLAAKFINCLMGRGKLGKDDPLEVFETALGNVAPIIEVRSRRIGGMTYQVPTEVSGKRRVSLAIRWVVQSTRAKRGRSMYLRLADELMDAYRRQGTAYEKRENTHKMAEANRAFAHFARR
jgi:small subunit ribosomal protein S7